MKFIARSKAIRNLLKDVDADLLSKDDEIEVDVSDGRLSIETISGKGYIYVEAQTAFIAKVNGRQLKKLSRVLGMLEEQLVVIDLSHNYRIGIQGILL